MKYPKVYSYISLAKSQQYNFLLPVELKYKSLYIKSEGNPDEHVNIFINSAFFPSGYCQLGRQRTMLTEILVNRFS